MFMSPEMSNYDHADLHLANSFTLEMFKHSCTEGGDVCTLSGSLRVKLNWISYIWYVTILKANQRQRNLRPSAESQLISTERVCISTTTKTAC